jgi:ATP-binding cassette subfamily B protein
MLLMTGAAAVAVGASIVIPLVTRSVVDGPIAEGDRSGLIPLGLLALGLGVLEAGLVFIRRWVQSYAALGMETTVRDDLYAHLQRLPVAFHDRWQTGQLLSRQRPTCRPSGGSCPSGWSISSSTSPRSSRSWRCSCTSTALAILRPPRRCRCVHLAQPLAGLPEGFAARAGPAGDLATFVEESAVGVRVIRSFGRRDHVGREFRRGARTLHDSAVGKATLVARFWSLFDLVPSLTLGGCCCSARSRCPRTR